MLIHTYINLFIFTYMYIYVYMYGESPPYLLQICMEENFDMSSSKESQVEALKNQLTKVCLSLSIHIHIHTHIFI